MDSDTPRNQFDSTLWNVVLCARDRNDPGSSAALETLCGTYWYPLYAYARRRHLDPVEAEDAVQDLFSRLLSRDFLKNVSPEKGRFRAFLLASFNNLLAEEHSRKQTIKRGGGFRFVSLDESAPEQRYKSEPADGLSPDKLFDRRCAFTLLNQALAALQTDYESAAQGAIFAELRPALSPGGGAPAYTAIGERLGLSEGAVKMQVSRLRQRFQIKFRAAVAGTVAEPDQVEEEIQHLMAALSQDEDPHPLS